MARSSRRLWGPGKAAAKARPAHKPAPGGTPAAGGPDTLFHLRGRAEPAMRESRRPRHPPSPEATALARVRKRQEAADPGAPGGSHRSPGGAQFQNAVLRAHENPAGLGAEAEALRGAQGGGRAAPTGPQQPQVPHAAGTPDSTAPLTAPPSSRGRAGAVRRHMRSPTAHAPCGIGAVRLCGRRR